MGELRKERDVRAKASNSGKYQPTTAFFFAFGLNSDTQRDRHGRRRIWLADDLREQEDGPSVVFLSSGWLYQVTR